MAARGSTVAGGSFRWRLIAALMGLLVVTLTIVGAALYTLVRGQSDARVEAELRRAADEFHVLATQGIDPRTGRPFDNPEALLGVALERTVLAPTEGVLGFVDGAPHWEAHAAVAVRPEDDAAFVGRVAPLTRGTEVRLGGVATSTREYRYVVAPVEYRATGRTGALVRVVDMDAERRPLAQMLTDYALIALATLAVASAAVALLAGQLLRPLGRLRDAAARITEQDLGERVPVVGRDEFATLTTTVNQMLDRIESGVTAQRSLLDDVGHELRTPVTVVRGHLELMDSHDADDVAATRAVALDELDRMGGLVNDLLTLAKAGQPDFLHRRPTELATLTDTVLSKARMLGDRRWSLSRVAEEEAFLDPDRITQAWLQLAANAVTYSEPGTPIQVGSRVSFGDAYLWVADRGMGIAPDELDVVRSRFGRAAGVRGHIEGSGLGLSIVDSIAAAHGGRLDIDSTPGVGSTFTIVIPLHPDEGEP